MEDQEESPKQSKNTKEWFKFDPDLTDITFVVENRKLHLSKATLMIASPVFRAMFTHNFKEKRAKEIALPGKDYDDFVLFLRCIHPHEYVELNDRRISAVLPLAQEYDVASLLKECQSWLLKEIELKCGKEASSSKSPTVTVWNFMMKCVYYGLEYKFDEVYKTVIKYVVDADNTITRITGNPFYKILQEKHKFNILEARCKAVEAKAKHLERKCSQSKMDDKEKIDDLESQLTEMKSKCSRLEEEKSEAMKGCASFQNLTINVFRCPQCRICLDHSKSLSWKPVFK